MIVQVYINSDSPALNREFHYAVPDKYKDKVKKGIRVKVPFGVANRQREAYVTDIFDEQKFPHLKDITRPIDSEPVITEEAIKICHYISEYCFCNFASAVKLFLPPGMEMKFLESVELTEKVNSDQGIKFIKKSAKRQRLVQIIADNGGKCEIEQLKDEMGKGAIRIISALMAEGLIVKSLKEKQKANEKRVRVVYYCGDENPYDVSEKLGIRAPVQAAVVEMLAQGEEYTVSDIEAVIPNARSAVESLNEKGLVEYKFVEVLRSPLNSAKANTASAAILSGQQQTAVDKIENSEKNVILIHGVTGSGKTEVYMEAAANVIEKGKQVIILVPEIALTSQITYRFYRRFGDSVAVIHSALSMGERLDEWRRIKNGDAKIVVGARSAIFAPCENLGLIIIDEEHESSYKSEASPRYHAKNIALMRGRINGCKVVLASATPCIESYYMAKSGQYELVEMKERYNKKPLPTVEIVDMRKELEEGNKAVVSRRLAVELKENLNNKCQSILLLNRRGYSTFVSCRSCGYVFTCPNCSVSMTYHLHGNNLVCHMCGYSRNIPVSCPECGSDKVKDFGKGTQKAEAQIKEIFPSAKIMRMDMDSTAGKKGHEKIIESFRDDGGDILLGTQMVAKGLDFSNVTLVGVLAADSALNMNDFRASERAFNLITQVCGRAGRGEIQGRAVIQTYMPENKVLHLAAKQDYKTFYDEEIVYRKNFMYPPFCKLVNIIFSSTDKESAKEEAEKALKMLNQKIADYNIAAKVYGGGEAPIAKIKNRYRYRVWLKVINIHDILHILEQISKLGREKSGLDLSVIVDINPNNMN